MKKVALIAGAQGVIGKNLADYLMTLEDWEVIGLSRRGGASSGRLTHIAVDLLDRADTEQRLSHLPTVTHIFYTAYVDKPTWEELVAPNMTMLQNLMEVVEPVATQLQHVSLMQGYKVYGAHLGAFTTPAKESEAGKHMSADFNMDQQHYLEALQAGKSWSWSAIRPSVVGGTALGNPMNLALLIATYASIAKEMGAPLRFPGKPGAYNKIMEMTDAGLLAKATVWASTTPAAANQAFNITNGDLFRWEAMWPEIGAYFGLEVEAPLPMSLNEVMPAKAGLWEKMKAQHGLLYDYKDVASWGFGDFVFSWDFDFFADGSKARRLGFHEYVDTIQMFLGIFDELKRNKVIP
ncbi:nucleoside-diphosphate-sugar epimerase [Chitinophaga dinghuensis]|uniref:Nucleoside-diphosphate-sugar epimerase n=1 Tax=Chitinophaga dinghuensis TaxID=1539050 RepID=A0A327W625_9BACT|nr:SDR family oxidoreductase [Chitinophaga dinghuensis]RAJ85855.1 nucleoside-diphosphate-sugar epimerase [Chitinophaga dinghuensis]